MRSWHAPLLRGDEWREIGVGFVNAKNDTITVLLDAVPVTGKLVLMKPKQQDDAVEANTA